MPGKFLLLLLLPIIARAEVVPRQLVFTNVTVIDISGAVALPDMTVIIEDDRITALDSARVLEVPAGAQVVNARGKFLIPGLWDMHAHLYIMRADYNFRMLLANGITAVRDMGGALNQAQFDVWRREMEQGQRLVPRLVVAQAIVDGPRPVNLRSSIGVRDAAGGRLVVDALERSGANFVKVYSLLPRDAYLAIADEAATKRIPFAGHVPDSVTAAEASAAGQASFEHLIGVGLASSTKEAELRARLTKELAGTLTADADWQERIWIEAESFDSHAPAKAAELFAQFVKNGTWQCPTLLAWHAVLTEATGLSNRARQKYVPPELEQLWNSSASLPRRSRTQADAAQQTQRFLRMLGVVKAMHDAGVGLLAGTDTPSVNCLPGFCLHDELELLVQAGLTPLQALQTATVNPARYLGRERDLGTIEAGKLADLVLLDADPLTDIRNTQKISAVVVSGRLLNRAKLDQMLAEIETGDAR